MCMSACAWGCFKCPWIEILRPKDLHTCSFLSVMLLQGLYRRVFGKRIVGKQKCLPRGTVMLDYGLRFSLSLSNCIKAPYDHHVIISIILYASSHYLPSGCTSTLYPSLKYWNIVYTAPSEPSHINAFSAHTLASSNCFSCKYNDGSFCSPLEHCILRWELKPLVSCEP